MLLESKDVFEARSSIFYDDYGLLPIEARQWLNNTDYLSTTATYNYRVMQAHLITDPNGNRAIFDFTPLGLLDKSGLIGKDTINKPYPAYVAEGDLVSEQMVAGKRVINYQPTVILDYDFFAFRNGGNPVWVRTTKREKHYQQDPNPPTLVMSEYTDGFGRLLQTRAQAEDVIFGDSLFGDSGLPEDQTVQNQPAVDVERGVNDPLNVVVSGWKVYNNKGKVVEQYEPYFDRGFDYDNAAVGVGEKVRMFYDPRGNVIRTINPDNTEQWVVHGVPDTLSSVSVNNHWSITGYTPTPWESYTYDANDLAIKTGFPASGHDFTPKSAVVDGLGRTLKTIDHKATATAQDVVMKYAYDIRGNLLQVTDAMNRIAFEYSYDLRSQPKKEGEEEKKLPPLRSWHIDSAAKLILFDATGKAIEMNDAKGALILNGYDAINRTINVWAKDKVGETSTLRQHLIYGDSGGLTRPQDNNYLGRLYQHYDEAGLLQINNYDYKGNTTEKIRKVVSDSELLSIFGGGAVDCYRVNWTGLNTAILDSHEYKTNMAYDALNRITAHIYPEDVVNKRKVLLPVYNNAGALEKVNLLDDIGGTATTYVEHIAYNAKGQRLLAAYGNGIMTRYVYEIRTFRLTRLRIETYSKSSHIFTSNGSVKQDTAYQYDLAGNIITTKDAVSGCGVGGANSLQRNFEYDSLYRLLRATGRENAPTITPIWDDSYRANTNGTTTAYTQNYAYDKMGNILSLQHIGANNFTRNFNYNSAENKLQSIDIGGTNFAYSYDTNGNQLSETANRKMEWDYADRMRCFYTEASGSITKYTQYLYDGGGNRVKKLTRTQSGNYDSSSYIDSIFEYRTDGTDEQNTLHVMDDRSQIATLRIGNDFGDNTPAIKYNLEDHLGSSTQQLQDNGVSINKEEYYPFGETSFGSHAKKRYKFCGKERDGESGLYYYGARYYNSWTCRFVSVDPLAAMFSHHSSYLHVNNNPLIFIDPSGMAPERKESDARAMKEHKKHQKQAAKHERKFKEKIVEPIVAQVEKIRSENPDISNDEINQKLKPFIEKLLSKKSNQRALEYGADTKWSSKGAMGEKGKLENKSLCEVTLNSDLFVIVFNRSYSADDTIARSPDVVINNPTGLIINIPKVGFSEKQFQQGSTTIKFDALLYPDRIKVYRVGNNGNRIGEAIKDISFTDDSGLGTSGVFNIPNSKIPEGKIEVIVSSIPTPASVASGLESAAQFQVSVAVVMPKPDVNVIDMKILKNLGK